MFIRTRENWNMNISFMKFWLVDFAPHIVRVLDKLTTGINYFKCHWKILALDIGSQKQRSVSNYIFKVRFHKIFQYKEKAYLWNCANFKTGCLQAKFWSTNLLWLNAFETLVRYIIYMIFPLKIILIETNSVIRRKLQLLGLLHT